MSKKNKEGFETRAIHAGQKADPTTGAVMMPIYTSSTYEQESPGAVLSLIRISEPTRP